MFLKIIFACRGKCAHSPHEQEGTRGTSLVDAGFFESERRRGSCGIGLRRRIKILHNHINPFRRSNAKRNLPRKREHDEKLITQKINPVVVKSSTRKYKIFFGESILL